MIRGFDSIAQEYWDSLNNNQKADVLLEHSKIIGIENTMTGALLRAAALALQHK